MAQKDEHHGQQRTGSAGITNSQPAEEPAEESAVGRINQSATGEPWQHLKRYTHARIALGRVGISLPTKEVLDLGLSHAIARDAIHLPLDAEALEASIQALGFSTLQVHSNAPNRQTYLLRPDFGRRLNDESRQYLQSFRVDTPIDFMFVVGDGLSSLAVQRHAVPLLSEMQKHIPESWKVGPVVIAKQARVALADKIGEILGANMVAMLIGERPGLSSPDSLGIYLTYAPRADCTDAARNCISNVRPEGLQYAAAAKKLIWLATEARQRKLSGVALKDESDMQEIDAQSNSSMLT